MSSLATDRGSGSGHRFFHVSRPRRFQLYGALGLLAYLILSTTAAMILNGPSTHPVKELFPFFSWSLFSKVKNERIEYSILVHSLDGEAFEVPQDMRRVEGLPWFKGSRSLSYKALQNLGSATRSKRPDAVEKRTMFEDRYFGRHRVDYEVVRHVFNPLNRWLDRANGNDRSSIGRFVYDGRSS